jgi:hypothetical protein
MPAAYSGCIYQIFAEYMLRLYMPDMCRQPTSRHSMAVLFTSEVM